MCIKVLQCETTCYKVPQSASRCSRQLGARKVVTRRYKLLRGARRWKFVLQSANKRCHSFQQRATRCNKVSCSVLKLIPIIGMRMKHFGVIVILFNLLFQAWLVICLL